MISFLIRTCFRAQMESELKAMQKDYLKQLRKPKEKKAIEG